MNFISMREKLTCEERDLRLQVATDLRERIEIVHTSEFSNFLKILFPAFVQVLRYKVAPSAFESSENKFRNILLEILNRLPNNDVLKPYVSDLLHLCMDVLERDNEENALICLRIIFDLHKNYRPALEGEVQPFLDQVQKIYKNLQQTLQTVFSSPAEVPSQYASLLQDSNSSLTDSLPDPVSSNLPETPLLRSIDSFKVLTECPLIVMLLFQLYPKYIESNIPVLIPLMMQALTLRAPATALKTHRSRYSEFLACQVKTLSFLTYLLRGFTNVMRPFEESISKSVIQLFKSCPAEAVTTRKELLVATRHILATDFRKGFFAHVDTLLDEKALIGQGRACYQALRPLAYSTLADLVHHIRTKLSLQQLSKIIYLFSRNIHDSSLPISIQTTSVRLLLNLVDFIYHNQDPDPSKGRILLVRILETLVSKFGTLINYIPKVISAEQNKSADTDGQLISDAMAKLRHSQWLQATSSSLKAEGETINEVTENLNNSTLFSSMSSSTTSKVFCGPPEVADTIRDVKTLVKTIVLGFKTVVWCVSNYKIHQDTKSNSQTPASHSSTSSAGTATSTSIPATDSSQVSAFVMSDEECVMIARFLKSGLKCLCLYITDPNKSQEGKEVLDHFAGSFTVLEPHNFRDIFHNHIQLVFYSILEDSAMLTIPQHLLANSNASRSFAEILLNFLITQVPYLSGEISQVQAAAPNDSCNDIRIKSEERASILLRLFKIVFGSVTLFPSNEPVLQPHLRTIVITCLRFATETRNPINYYFLLRALFRSISGGKFEMFYKEFLPLLPSLLSGLIRLQEHCEDQSTREVLLELCLTVPARLSSLLQYLPLLMRPLVAAVRSRGELVNLGLRTLEFWIDNLNPDFLYPIMSSQGKLLRDLIEALCSHVKPSPENFGKLALRLLGKLGGRNRRFLKDPASISYIKNPSNGISMEFTWNEDSLNTLKMNRFDVPFDSHIKMVCSLLSSLCNIDTDKKEPILIQHKEDAFRFLTGCLAAVMPLSKEDPFLYCPDHIRKQTSLPNAEEVSPVNIHEIDDKKSCQSSLGSSEFSSFHEALEREIIRLILRTLMEASVDNDLKSISMDFLNGLFIHFTVLILSCSSRSKPDNNATEEIFSDPLPLFITTGFNSRGKNFTQRAKAIASATWGSSELHLKQEDLNPLVLVEAIVDVLGNTSKDIIQVGFRALDIIVETVGVLCNGNKKLVVDYGGKLFDSMCEEFTHVCYKKRPNLKIAGVRGIAALTGILDDAWIKEHQLVLVRALVFVLADHPPEVPLIAVQDAHETVLVILNKCYKAESEMKEQEKDPDPMSCIPTSLEYKELFQFLVSELLSPKEPVRKCVQEILRNFEEFFQCSLSTLLAPYQEMLRQKIFLRPLRQLSCPVQIGYISALCFGLQLDPPIFSFSTELLGFLQEVWHLIEGDDSSLNVSSLSASASVGTSISAIPSSSASSTPNRRSGVFLSKGGISLSNETCLVENSLQDKLRIIAIQVIRAAFVNNPLEFSKHQDSRNRFIGVFFKSLSNQSEKVVKVAQESLGDVIAINKRGPDKALPKELLQSCLRPVLLNLADYRKLSLDFLNGLSKHLTLLSSCFNVTLGEKLLEHLQQWTEPEKIIASGIWKQGEEPHIAAGIINLFHLLPPSDTFLEPLVKCTIELEAVLYCYGSYGKMSSPYRVPLCKFLNRYSKQSIAFFLQKEQLLDHTHSSLFQSILKFKEAAPLRSVLTGEGGAEAIMTATFVAASRMIPSSQSSEDCSSIGECPSPDSDAKMQAQIQANSQKAHAQAMAAAQSQGMPAAQAQAKAKQAQESYIAKATAHVQSHQKEQLPSQQQASQIKAQIQANAQKVHQQALATAQMQGLKHSVAQERAKQAQVAYIQRANAQAREKLAQNKGSSSHISSSSTSSSLNIHGMSLSSDNSSVNSLQQNALELHFQGLRMVRTLAKLDKKWLARQKIMVNCLRKLWRSPSRLKRFLAEDSLLLKHQMESKLLVKCLIIYSREKPDDVQVLFDLLTVFLHRSVVNFTFLKDFYGTEVACGYDPENKKAILRLFLRMLCEPEASEDIKVQALQLLVLPMLGATFADPLIVNSKVVDHDVILVIMRDVLGGNALPNYSEALRIELLQLATLLIEHMGTELLDHRKELIKFAWNHLKSEDTTSKQWAYVNVCRFIAVYETPPKIILQVYVALLRTYQPDGRLLVRNALDILTPSLPKRLPPSDFIKAIKWTKKIIYEEGHTLPQLVHIWQVLVRQPALFYAYRAQFVPQMVNSLSRLALPPNSPLENRQLAVALVDLIFAWDQTRQERVSNIIDTTGFRETSLDSKKGEQLNVAEHLAPPRKKGKMTALSDSASSLVIGDGVNEENLSTREDQKKSPSQSSENEFQLNPAMLEMIINFLIRFSLGTAETNETKRLSTRCLQLYSTALRLWPGSYVRFQYFDKLIATASDKMDRSSSNPIGTGIDKSPLYSPNVLSTCLHIFNTMISPHVIEAQTATTCFILCNVSKIQKILEACFDKPEPVHSLLVQFLKRMINLYPPGKTPDAITASRFYIWLKDNIFRRLTQQVTVDTDQQTGSASSVKSQQPQQQASPSSSVKGNQDGTISYHGVVGILCSLTNECPIYVEQYIPCLLKLSQRLMIRHLQETAAANSTRTTNLQGSTGGIEIGDAVNTMTTANRVMATPSMALLEELRNKKTKLQSSSLNSMTSTSNATTNLNSSASPATTSTSSAINSPQNDFGVNTLISCLELLGNCSIGMTEHRKQLTTILHQGLEKSSSIPLLLKMTKMVGKWIIEDTPQHLLSPKEKSIYLAKMVMFDRLDEVSTRELSAEHAKIILELHKSPEAFKTSIVSPHISRPFMNGLMSADLSQRKQFFDHFSVLAGKQVDTRFDFLFKYDWESCVHRFWISICLDVLLDCIEQKTFPVLSASCHVLPKIPSQGTTNLTKVRERPKELETQLRQYYIHFQKHMEESSVYSLIEPLRRLSHIDIDLANSLWNFVFPLIWSTLDEQRQRAIVPNIQSILVKGYHRRRLVLPSTCSSSCNIVKSLLHGITLSVPQPYLPMELLGFLARTYDAWYYVIPIAEYHILSSETPNDDRERWVCGLSDLYKDLSETDMRSGLCLRFTTQQETRCAITLEAQGYIKEAQDVYFSVMSKVHANRISSSQLTKFEMSLWEERWVECARHLTQWGLLFDFAKSVQNQQLLLEAAWKKRDWGVAAQLLTAPSVVASCNAGCPETKLLQLYVALHDGNKKEIELLMEQATQLMLNQWQALPRVLSNAHVPLLHLFHKFIELKESSQMLNEIQTFNQQRTIPDFKTMLSTWRERLPNKWDSVILWDDILSWRSHVFTVITEAFSWSDAQQLACMHDSPWSIIKLAHTARKQGLSEVCLNALAKLYTVSTMDVQDAYSKLREQILICYENPEEHKGGLNIINNTNLEYFSHQQKAELFRLKALFLDALGSKSEANQSFSCSLQTCDSYGKAWLSWGRYCDNLFELQKQVQFAGQAMACYLQAIHQRLDSARLSLSRVLWLLSMDDEQGSLAHAFETHGKQLPIWIWIVWIPQLLTALARAEAPQIRGLLRGLAAKFPQSIYYTMRAFLLERREVPVDVQARVDTPAPVTPNPPPAEAAPNVFVRTKSGHVVAVPYGTNPSKVLEIPGVIGPPRSSPSMFGLRSPTVLTLQQWTAKVAIGADLIRAPISAAQYTEDLMGFLRRSHTSLANELESLLEEVIVRFRPEAEEELLSAIHALLIKCFQLPQHPWSDEVPASLRITLERVSKKFFVIQASNKSDAHTRFVKKYKNAFERDFLGLEKDLDKAYAKGKPESTSETKYETGDTKNTLGLTCIIHRLKLWKQNLQEQVKHMAIKLKLEECSKYLIEFSSNSVEIPGQYVTDSEPLPDLHVKLRQFESVVDVLHRHGFSQRRLALRGDNGALYYFLVQFAIPHITRTDERMMQLHLLLNRLLDKHKETRRRNLNYHVPVVILITPRVRLMEDHVSFISLAESGEDSDAVILSSKEKIAKVQIDMKKGGKPILPRDEDQMLSCARLQVYQEICNKNIPQTVLSTYMHSITKTVDELWKLRIEFCQHLALSAFLSYTLCVGDRSPSKLILSRENASILSCDFRPGYSQNGLIECLEAVPFRLTRNLHSFITPFAVDGPFANSITAVAECLLSKVDVMENQLSLFFRDDLLSWHASKTQPRPETEQRKIELQLRDRVSANVKRVIDRINSVSVQELSDSGDESTLRTQKVYDLIDAATNSSNLASMNPAWLPWL